MIRHRPKCQFVYFALRMSRPTKKNNPLTHRYKYFLCRYLKRNQRCQLWSSWIDFQRHVGTLELLVSIVVFCRQHKQHTLGIDHGQYVLCSSLRDSLYRTVINFLHICIFFPVAISGCFFFVVVWTVYFVLYHPITWITYLVV